jgi:3-deoxy-D-manno-octulosonic-acid transferase
LSCGNRPRSRIAKLHEALLLKQLWFQRSVGESLGLLKLIENLTYQKSEQRIISTTAPSAKLDGLTGLPEIYEYKIPPKHLSTARKLM